MWQLHTGISIHRSRELPVGCSTGCQQPTHAIYGDGISEKIKLFPPHPPSQSIYPQRFSSSICLSVISSLLLLLFSYSHACIAMALSLLRPVALLLCSLPVVIFISISFHFHYFFFVLSVFDDSSSELPFLIAPFLSFASVINLIYNFSVSSRLVLLDF
jgi:hypothetical protein